MPHPFMQAIFAHSQCPDHDQLFQYIKGNLSHAQGHDIETHLIDCRACTQVLENVPLLSPQEAEESVTRIRQRILSIIWREDPPKGKLYHFRPYA